MSMLDHDPNRDLGRDPYANRYSEMSEGSGYAPLIALFAIAAIVGGLFFFSPSSDQTKVATNNSPATQSAPAPTPPTPAPPAKAPAQQ